MTRYLTEDDALAAIAGLTQARRTTFLASRAVVPVQSDDGPLFCQIDLARLRLLCDLSNDFDLDDPAIAIVMSLIDQLHGARFVLQSLAMALANESEAVRERVGAALSAALR
ncbi:hypothetical protein [Pseudorhodobacter sp. MZDSW-24AT]|uniref:hypothetical protein n=1 Tax=Pseudorhodobacter sp. MZDSW-24AT TaxID=2052957 RepID=UPI000C1EFD30|nr:hypothetical protein [Pseudorhodobacter sp. MZDSW-24AT]PJF08858.1 hypothetical protein CUR21_10245 [Pseudorhodobacter sp. MZDSW-24AT]